MDGLDSGEDICRVCRAEATQDRPLFHPCMCTGSIKFIHQECLVQWLNHSKKEICELCKHRFVFKPIYAPDMPHTLPVTEFLTGLGKNLGKALQYWLHYTLVAIAWLGVVPLTSFRIYKCFFAGSISSLLTLPLDILSTNNMMSDCLKGCFVVGCSICAFIVLVWLREQIVVHGGPDWLEGQPEPIRQMNLPGAAGNWFGGIFGAGDGHGRNQNAANDNDALDARAGEEDHVVGNEDGDAQMEQHGGNEEVADENGEEGDESEDEPEVEPEPAPVDEWNPEWERAAEDLTWERFLGLDGSLVFLEHVFWIISLNTSFVLVFAFCPYHIGHFTLRAFSMEFQDSKSEFASLITCLIGYFAEAVTLLLLHSFAGVFNLKRARRILGMCYVVIKVALIMVVEVGVFPLICGWWIDICALPLFAVSLKDRQASFYHAPGTATFLHWLVGMLYVFYFASFVILLREILRQGVLWFLRNLNDPDFHPMQEMIHLPVYRHVRRFALSLVVFGTAILIKLWIPVQLIRGLFPNFLPFNYVLTSDIPVSELPLELLLLQVVLPALLEQAHTRQWIKNIVRLWVVTIAYLLDLRSYLLGDVPLDGVDPTMIHHQNPVNNNANQGGGQNAQGQNNAGNIAGQIEPQPYIKPKAFALRIICLLVLMSASMVISSFVGLTVPVAVGRLILSYFLGSSEVHELYTAATGVYVLWLCCRISVIVWTWLAMGFPLFIKKCIGCMTVVLKIAVLSIILLDVVPLLLGIIFDLVFVIPLRVPLNQTPLFYFWQNWAIGVLHTKILCALVMVGPNWWLKTVMETVYQDGINNIRVGFILQNLAFPVVSHLILVICIPYVMANGILSCTGISKEARLLAHRRIYPLILIIFLVVAALAFQGRQFRNLYERIKNEKYLVGQRLVNYHYPTTSNADDIPQLVNEAEVPLQ